MWILLKNPRWLKGTTENTTKATLKVLHLTPFWGSWQLFQTRAFFSRIECIKLTAIGHQLAAPEPTSTGQGARYSSLYRPISSTGIGRKPMRRKTSASDFKRKSPFAASTKPGLFVAYSAFASKSNLSADGLS